LKDEHLRIGEIRLAAFGGRPYYDNLFVMVDSNQIFPASDFYDEQIRYLHRIHPQLI